jgi:hypothetical protein
MVLSGVRAWFGVLLVDHLENSCLMGCGTRNRDREHSSRIADP